MRTAGAVILAAAGIWWARIAPPPEPPPVRFVDVTDAAGVDFTHQASPTTQKYLPETMGAGVAMTQLWSGWGARFIDYDNDGWKDLLFVQGHVRDTIERTSPHLRYRQHPLLAHKSTAASATYRPARASRSAPRGRGAAWPWPTSTGTATWTPWSRPSGAAPTCSATRAETAATG